MPCFVPEEQVLVLVFEPHVEEAQVVLLLVFDGHEDAPLLSAVAHEDVPDANAGSVKYTAMINAITVFVTFNPLLMEDGCFLSFGKRVL